MTATCALCAEPLDDAPIVGTKSRGGKPSRRVACLRCGLVQTQPQPSKEELDAYYASGAFYDDHRMTCLIVTDDNGTEHFVGPDDAAYAAVVAKMHRTRAEAVVRDLGLQPGARVLEIGCGAGLTLHELQRLGMDVCGLEPDSGRAAEARAKVGDIRIVEATLEAVVGSPPVDAVISFHVLEHLPDPLGALAQMRSLLKPGGAVWVEVPNVGKPGLPLSEHWLWVHLFDFEAHTLATLLGRAGLSDIHVGASVPRLLRGWARHGQAQPQDYVDHDGPRGAEVAAFLQELEAQRDAGTPVVLANAPQAPELHRLRAGAAPYDSPEYETLRAELASYDASVARLATAYHDATDMIGELSLLMDDEAMVRLESHHHDAWVHGFAMGEGHAYWRAKTMLAGAANGMRLVELMDGEKKHE